MSNLSRMNNFRVDGEFDQINTIDNAIHHFLENCDSGALASVQLNLKNDQGKLMSIGLCSSNCAVPGTEGSNSGGIVLEADANIAHVITYLKDFIFKTNPDDDGDFTKVVEVAKIRSNGSFITDGAVKCGPSCPELQFTKIDGTTGLVNTTTTYTSGVAKAKILGVETYVEATDGRLIPRNNNGLLDQYECAFDSNGDLTIKVFASATNVASRPFKALICHEK